LPLKKGISLHWLLVGQGEMLFNGTGNRLKRLCSNHAKLIELFDALSADQQKEALQLISEKKTTKRSGKSCSTSYRKKTFRPRKNVINKLL